MLSSLLLALQNLPIQDLVVDLPAEGETIIPGFNTNPGEDTTRTTSVCHLDRFSSRASWRTHLTDVTICITLVFQSSRCFFETIPIFSYLG